MQAVGRPVAGAAVLTIAVSMIAAACATGTADSPEGEETPEMTEQRATGVFEVEMTPETSEADDHGNRLGRMALAKSFSGDLEGTGAGTMLAARTEDPRSAGYVAMERVDGSLDGRRGSFILQHSGTMEGDEQALAITVVPGTGTGELRGIRGRMTIEVTESGHRYDFRYSLPR